MVLGEVRDTLKHLDAWVAPSKVSTPALGLPGASFIVAEPYGVVCERASTISVRWKLISPSFTD